jgi:hypothetical protein
MHGVPQPKGAQGTGDVQAVLRCKCRTHAHDSAKRDAVTMNCYFCGIKMNAEFQDTIFVSNFGETKHSFLRVFAYGGACDPAIFYADSLASCIGCSEVGRKLPELHDKTLYLPSDQVEAVRRLGYMPGYKTPAH